MGQVHSRRRGERASATAAAATGPGGGAGTSTSSSLNAAGGAGGAAGGRGAGGDVSLTRPQAPSRGRAATAAPAAAPAQIGQVVPTAGRQVQGAQSGLPPAEMKRTCTIRNDVNLKKKSLAIAPDPSNPGRYLVSFTFDSATPSTVTISYLVLDGVDDGSMPSLKQQEAVETTQSGWYPKGLGLQFKQTSGGFDIDSLSSDDLSLPSAEKPNKYHVVIRLNSLDEEGNPRQFQTTYATLAKNTDGEWNITPVKQKIWVDGISYELQEIYGIEQNGENQTEIDGLDSGKECVICLAAQRDTTVLPCRHMCMCTDCARELSFQTNKCPICRCTVEQLLQIKVTRKGGDANASSTAAATTNPGAAAASAGNPVPLSFVPPPPSTNSGATSSFLSAEASGMGNKLTEAAATKPKEVVLDIGTTA